MGKVSYKTDKSQTFYASRSRRWRKLCHYSTAWRIEETAIGGLVPSYLTPPPRHSPTTACSWSGRLRSQLYLREFCLVLCSSCRRKCVFAIYHYICGHTNDSPAFAEKLVIIIILFSYQPRALANMAASKDEYKSWHAVPHHMAWMTTETSNCTRSAHLHRKTNVVVEAVRCSRLRRHHSGNDDSTPSGVIFRNAPSQHVSAAS